MVWGIDEVTDCLKDVKLRQDPLLLALLIRRSSRHFVSRSALLLPIKQLVHSHLYAI